MEPRFKNHAKKNKPYVKPGAGIVHEVTRARIPKGREVIGMVEQRVGANRMIVKCFDEKIRNCRIPGSLRRSLWIRPGDIVIVEPWEFQGDDKGDILFKYTPAAIDWLKKRGYIKESTGNEF
ncbi:MAG: translation initiation factor eIF-1A [Nanoarchaeota archaeon]|nr:translation initiation factor eIF-1A [Nanoarchaeota archaeon]